jgi:alkanesulfonate monooxygenase SsuD/methylene tetrahydromethanopterin reductase-like flavin-dependent oxidoreductase (luciferase family)
MPDYGHDLMFGANVIPSSRDAAETVGLAQLADRAGLDLITFQDHPYQPAFLDTWTLLSYVAARTRTARLAGNVHSLPLRHPAVLARSAASLDLLSGGRFELGLGAGAFWDAIEAMGGPRRTPGEAVTALAEAIEIIRETWDTDTRGGVRVRGKHYHVNGAKRGPRPAHDISIWLGAYGPRMLRLTGRAADGWIPSLGNLPAEKLAAANAIIDEAAERAGRNPHDVRRLLNIGADVPTGRLVDLAISHGFSAFLVMTDDPAEVQRLAEEVAPAVRELVGKERAG